MNRKLKRALELCLGTCGSCSHFKIFEQYCTKKHVECRGSNPACDDYDMWKFKEAKHDTNAENIIVDSCC